MNPEHPDEPKTPDPLSVKDESKMITAEELNFMVFRYLQENGYSHTAFVFRQEARLANYHVDNALIPSGLLLSFMQYGMSFFEIEEKISTGADCYRDPTGPDGMTSLFDYCRFMEHPLPPNHTAPLSNISGADRRFFDSDQQYSGSAQKGNSRANQMRSFGGSERSYHDVHQNGSRTGGEDTDGAREERAMQTTDEMMNYTTEPGDRSSIGEGLKILKLAGHKSRILMCEWDSFSPILATSSGDKTVRTWSIQPGFGRNVPAILVKKRSCEVVKHEAVTLKDSNPQAVTAYIPIGWSPVGGILATGSSDGTVRTWSSPGGNVKSSTEHASPILCLKWNRSGTHFITGSMDTTIGLWDGSTGGLVGRINAHRKPVYDVSWRDDDVFASCAEDSFVKLYSASRRRSFRILRGHEGEVNAVGFSPDGTLLASIGEDLTVNIWSCSPYRLLHNLKEHKGAVYAMDWKPGPTESTLATAAFDCSIKIWEPRSGECLLTMTHESARIFCLKYSPEGMFLASGANDGTLTIWCATTGIILHKFEGDGAIYALDWFQTGNMLAVGTETGEVFVVDTRKVKEIESVSD